MKKLLASTLQQVRSQLKLLTLKLLKNTSADAVSEQRSLTTKAALQAIRLAKAINLSTSQVPSQVPQLLLQEDTW